MPTADARASQSQSRDAGAQAGLTGGNGPAASVQAGAAIERPDRGLAGAIADRLFPSLRHAQYFRLWQANIGSQMAFWMQSITQGWLVVELTDSAFALGIMGVAMSVPMLVLSPFGGVLADRADKKKLLLVAQTVFALNAITIGTLVALGLIHVIHLAVAAFVLGAMFGLNMPARNALMSDLVPRRDLANAVGLNSTTMNASRILGPSLAGVLIGVIGIAGTYFTQVAGYVWSTFNILRITTPRREGRRSGSALTALRDGFVYVLRSKPILATMVLAIAPAVFSMPTIQLLPAYVKQELLGDARMLGALMSSFGLGALGGSLTVVVFARFRYKGRALLGGALLFGLLVIVLGFTRSATTSAAVLVATGFVSAIYMATNQTIIQLVVPSELRGRVLSIFMLSWGMMPLGLLPLSAVAQSRGVPTAMVIGGTISVAVVLIVALWRPALWNLQPEAEPEPVNEATAVAIAKMK